MKKSTVLLVSALAMATAAYAQNPQSTVSTKGNTTMTAQVQTNNIRNAQALINTFVSGDSAKARSLLAPNYIQHNLNYATGADAFVGAVDYLAAAPVKTTVKTVRAFADGDKVFLHNIYNFAGSGEQVAFDIFRFDKDGKIAEHWDNLTALTPANPSGHTQTDGTLAINEKADKEQTRQVVTGFVNDVLHGKNLANFANYFNGDNYIQHNSQIADGVSGLTAALEAMGKQGITMQYTKTHQVLAQGDFALAVSEGTFAGKPTAFYDLFRVENGKIAEHWDVIETITDKSTWKNQNGKF
ncbi:nuclear transport factor 2 family protein [Glaesserella sp.]|uniref:nuclear transport factor 2 family protein n=1 Tax=Glaesserella sp. TaxID=2094731 RepID=UPI0035A03A8A